MLKFDLRWIDPEGLYEVEKQIFKKKSNDLYI